MRSVIPLTALGMGVLFFLVDPDAEIGVTMASRPMTDDEQAQYRASPMSARRRKPGTTVEDDAKLAARKRVAALIREAEATRTFGGTPREAVGSVPSRTQGWRGEWPQ